MTTSAWINFYDLCISTVMRTDFKACIHNPSILCQCMLGHILCLVGNNEIE